MNIGASSGGSGKYWCAFGISQPQWGYKASLTAEATAYPIAFTSLVYVFPFVYEHKQTSNTAHAIAVDVTNKAFKFYAGQYNLPSLPLPDANGWWLAGGFQPQWGYCSSRTATFPIPFPTAALFVVAIPKTTSTSATATGAEYLGTTSVNLYLHGTSGWYFVGGH